jgi:uncharacterized protein YggT (Ycf19 family)
MTNDHRHDDPDHQDHDHDHADETRVVERQTYVERERPVSTGYVPPAQPAGGQVNVSSSRGTDYVEPARSPLYWARRVLSLLFGILTVLLALRLILLLLVANQTNEIVDFVYGVTEPFVAPFRGIFAFDQVTPGGGSVFDIAAVVAFVGWLLIYLLLMAILSLADRDRSTV